MGRGTVFDVNRSSSPVVGLVSALSLIRGLTKFSPVCGFWNSGLGASPGLVL